MKSVQYYIQILYLESNQAFIHHLSISKFILCSKDYDTRMKMKLILSLLLIHRHKLFLERHITLYPSNIKHNFLKTQPRCAAT